VVPCTLLVSVTDTGIGMLQEEQSRIFNRFSQANSRTSKEYGGSGLGLSISKKLAKLMNGFVSVTSAVGEGSTFSFGVQCGRIIHTSTTTTTTTSAPTTPTTITTTTTIGSPSSAMTTAPGYPLVCLREVDSKRVLIVEDNAMNQTLLARLFTLKGFKVDLAGNGQEGLDTYTTNMREYSCVMMDIQMPVMGGMQCTKFIRLLEAKHGIKPVPIIGLSGNARDEHRKSALDAGMNEYITKPVHKQDLFTMLGIN